jgi:hypothetical protein
MVSTCKAYSLIAPKRPLACISLGPMELSECDSAGSLWHARPPTYIPNRSLSQQLKVSILPGGKHQGSKDELNVIWELHAKCPRSHESPGWILPISPFLAYLC